MIHVLAEAAGNIRSAAEKPHKHSIRAKKKERRKNALFGVPKEGEKW